MGSFGKTKSTSASRTTASFHKSIDRHQQLEQLRLTERPHNEIHSGTTAGYGVGDWEARSRGSLPAGQQAMIWQAGQPGPLEIQVTIGLASGWFTLAALNFDSQKVPISRIDSEDADGDALFRVDLAQDTLFKLQILAGYVSGPDTDVMVAVRKSGAVLPCMDNSTKVQNKTGNSYKSQSIGKIKQGQNLTFNFSVWS
jgi:hypothetical protein